jgi:hypothetical protein
MSLEEVTAVPALTIGRREASTEETHLKHEQEQHKKSDIKH